MKRSENYNILFGAKLNSNNRGVNALAIGGIGFIKTKFNSNKTILVNLDWNISSKGTKSIYIDSENKDIKWYNFSKRSFFLSIIDAILYRIFQIKPHRELSKLILHSNACFDLNEGDSFSDIYGKRRFFVHFTKSFTTLFWKKPLIFLPQTIGPFNTIYGKYLSKYILKRLNDFYVRDDAAFEFLDKAKLKPKSHVDVAVKMKPKPVKLQLRQIDEKQTGKIFGININGLMYFDTYGFATYKSNYKKIIIEIINFIINEGFKVILIPHTYTIQGKSVENDYTAIRDVIKQLSKYNKNMLDYLAEEYDAQEIKHIISQVNLFIGSRMHSCIAALSSNVPTIGIAYSYKFKGTFKQFNQDNYVVNMQDISLNEIRDLLANLIKNEGNIVKELTHINNIFE